MILLGVETVGQSRRPACHRSGAQGEAGLRTTPAESGGPRVPPRSTDNRGGTDGNRYGPPPRRGPATGLRRQGRPYGPLNQVMVPQGRNERAYLQTLRCDPRPEISLSITSPARRNRP